MNRLFVKLREAGRLDEIVFMGTLSFLCFAFWGARLAIFKSYAFYFLNWNLFLAFIPWALTTLLIAHPKAQSNKLLVGAVICVWLLFFPNAPYILTDFIHLRYRSVAPLWYNLTMILAFAWTGLLFGFLSLWDIERVLAAYMKRKFVTALSVMLLFVSAFGIYLGRYLRWNSWDVMKNPVPLVYDIGDRIANPIEHQRTWGFTLSMGLFLCVLYFSFRLIAKRKTNS